MKQISLITALLLVSAAAFAQANTCQYTFTFPQYSFQFCLTGSGTLAMLQSPIGVDHLDTVNPIEGWSWNLIGTVPHGGDVFLTGNAIPAFANHLGAADTVTQPNGPGTLPIKFEWRYSDMWEMVTAQPGQRSITLQVGIPAEGVWWGGSLTRLITPRVDGKTVNYFRHLRVGGLAYVNGGEALVMQSAAQSCSGPGELFAASQCIRTVSPFNGYGTLIAEGGYSPLYIPYTTSLTVTYKIF
jgi:hypothetical protein